MISTPLERGLAFTDVAPPRYLAKVAQLVAQPGDKAAATVAWGKPQDGLEVGIGAVRTSLKSPQWPIIDAYLENRGRALIDGIIRGGTKFIVKLDGTCYAEADFGGPVWPLAPGERYGPMSVETRTFHRVPARSRMSLTKSRATSPAPARF